MKTAVSLYSEGKLLTTPLAADPSVTLIENGPLFFGILLAEGCSQASWGSSFFLDRVTWFRASTKDFKHSEHARVCLSEKDGLFAASDTDALKAFPNMSRMPFTTLFITDDTYENLRAALSKGKGSQLFEFVQHRFGGLPGFLASKTTLATPSGYAEVEQAPNVPMLT